MDIARLAVVVIVSYILGLATGMVGGVVFSFREFAAPPGATAAVAEASPSPTKTATDESPSEKPSAAPSASKSPKATETTAKASPSARPSKVAVAEPAPSPSPDEASPESTPSSTSGAVSETESPSPEASETTTEPTPESTPEPKPTPKPKPQGALLSITANKGKGFSVFVDGRKVGVTPIVVTVAPDKTHLIKVVGGGDYSTWQEKIKPTAGEKRAVQATLAYVPPPPPVARPAPVYYPPSRPVYAPPPSTGGRPGVYGNTRW